MADKDNDAKAQYLYNRDKQVHGKSEKNRIQRIIPEVSGKKRLMEQQVQNDTQSYDVKHQHEEDKKDTFDEDNDVRSETSENTLHDITNIIETNQHLMTNEHKKKCIQLLKYTDDTTYIRICTLCIIFLLLGILCGFIIRKKFNDN
tara:strand:+ start:273 stop:710 length:438 start_codon:yes stop_codon:yes gene_type:complete